MTTKICSIDGCGGKYMAKGYCVAHYTRLRKYGDPLGKPQAWVAPVCTVDECEAKVHARGWCSLHYKRWQVNGSPLLTTIIVNDDNARFDSKVVVDPLGGCHCWQGYVLGSGYGQLNIGGRGISAHRFAYARANGAIPDGQHVLHRCDNRICVNPEHLFLGSHEANMADMVAKGRQARQVGSSHGGAKLTEVKVLAIREMFSEGVKQVAICSRMGLSPTTVSMVVNRKTWRHVS